MGGSHSKTRIPGEKGLRKHRRMTADDILNAKSPTKKNATINPYGPGGALYDRTMSVNYDAAKEKRVNDLK